MPIDNLKKLLFLILLAAYACAGTDTVILSSDNPADLSAAEAAAGTINAIIVNSSWGETDETAIAEIGKIAPLRVIIIGGQVAVPEQMALKLKEAGIEYERVWGEDRYETAAKIAGYFWKNAQEAIIVEGTDKEAMEEARIEAKERKIPIVFMEKGLVREKVNEQLERLNVKQVSARLAPDTDKAALERTNRIKDIRIIEVDKQERAWKEIEESALLLKKTKELIEANKEKDAAGIAVSELRVLAEQGLERARQAYKHEDYGEAYGHAVSSESISKAASKIYNRITMGWYGSQVEKAEENIREKGLEEVKPDEATLETEKEEQTNDSPGNENIVPGKATIDLYVMSQCPYAAAVEQNIKPVLDELGDSMELRINYIAKETSEGITSLHGPDEIDGDIVQLCAAKYSPHWYLDMIICQNRDQKEIPGNWEACAIEAGVDAGIVRSCYEGEEGKKLLSGSVKKAALIGAMGSPTIYINGQMYTGDRSSLSLMQKLEGNAAGGETPPVAEEPTPEEPVPEEPIQEEPTPESPILKPLPGNIYYCAEKRPEMCTALYAPVCGARSVADARGVMELEYRTYSNSCNACADEKISTYYNGACSASVAASGASSAVAVSGASSVPATSTGSVPAQ